jgi:hypothetical protein
VGLTVLIACSWRQITRQLVGSPLIRGAWRPHCGTSRVIGGFYTDVPGKWDFLGSDPVSSGSLTMNTSRCFEPSGNTPSMTRCHFMKYFNFHGTSHLELLAFRVKEDRHDVSETELVSFFTIISWARCVTLCTPSGLANFWRGGRLDVKLLLCVLWTHTGVWRYSSTYA